MMLANWLVPDMPPTKACALFVSAGNLAYSGWVIPANTARRINVVENFNLIYSSSDLDLICDCTLARAPGREDDVPTVKFYLFDICIPGIRCRMVCHSIFKVCDCKIGGIIREC